MIVAVVKIGNGRHRVEMTAQPNPAEPAATRIAYSAATSLAAETVAAFVRSLHVDAQRVIWERGA